MSDRTADVDSDFISKLNDVSFLTSMTLVLLGNYSQTGHFGGPLSYTPANVFLHLGGPNNGGLSYDIRNPKHPFTDKFMLAGGHCIPTCYALWMILYEAMDRAFKATGDERYKCKPGVSILPVDCLGFRRGPDAVKKILVDAGLVDHPIFAQAKEGGRGIRALMGHSETTDVTNDVNGGPSGVGVATSVGRALFWDFIGAPESLKVIAFEGEFAFTEGHAQELKTIALAQQVGKRLRIFFSYNNAGIDDSLVGGVIHEKYADVYNIKEQFSSYGWNVFEIRDGSNHEELREVFKKMEEWPLEDRRPMVVIAHTIKGWWPVASEGKLVVKDTVVKQITSYASHPYGFGMNSSYFVSLAETFEEKYGVKFEGIRDGPPKNETERVLQFKTNVDIVMSVLEREGLGRWIADRLLHIASTVRDDLLGSSPFTSPSNPFKDERLKVQNLPVDPVNVELVHPTTGKEVKSTIALFSSPGPKKGARRAISEIGKYINYVTNNRLLTLAADLSHSINLEGANFLGHYDPVSNPRGTRLKGGIQEAGHAATIAGLCSQTISLKEEEHVGLWGFTGTYGAFTPFFYVPLRIFSQQNQESPFELGVVTVVAGHSGPETAADARSHFGIFSPEVWTLFPRGQIININLWDYNDVSPAYFAAVEIALSRKESKIIVIHVARPDFAVADRSKFFDKDIKAASKGLYLIREFSSDLPPMGTVFVHGASATFNTVSLLGKLDEEKLNVRIVSVISEELFQVQPQEYRDFILPFHCRYDSMVVSTMTKRILPVAGLGPLTEQYSLTADWDDRWRTGGTEDDVIKEARLDKDSILEGIRRFVGDRESRLSTQFGAFSHLMGTK